MSRTVTLMRLARADLVQYHRRAAEHAPVTAARWLSRFEAALAKLADNPFGCSIAPESKKSPIELRQLLFGKRPNVYRAIYMVTEDSVCVLRAQRRWPSREEIRDSLES